MIGVCEPTWALPLALVAVGLLTATVIGFMVLPLRRAVYDPHLEPFGDEPRLPR